MLEVAHGLLAPPCVENDEGRVEDRPDVLHARGKHVPAGRERGQCAPGHRQGLRDPVRGQSGYGDLALDPECRIPVECPRGVDEGLGPRDHGSSRDTPVRQDIAGLQRSRRVSIPKDDGSLRYLGISPKHGARVRAVPPLRGLSRYRASRDRSPLSCIDLYILRYWFPPRLRRA